MKKRVLFDFDGTFVDSMSEIFGAVSHVFISQGLNVPSFEEYITKFRFPFGAFYRERGVRLSDDEIYNIYIGAYHEKYGVYNPPLYDDVLGLIKYLRGIDHTISVVTANSHDNITRVLEGAKLINVVDCFSACDKVEAIRELVNSSFFGPKTFYVGDVVADMIDAKKAGAFPVAVLRNGLIKLAYEFHTAGARMCISSLSHLLKVIR